MSKMVRMTTAAAAHTAMKVIVSPLVGARSEKRHMRTELCDASVGLLHYKRSESEYVCTTISKV